MASRYTYRRPRYRAWRRRPGRRRPYRRRAHRRLGRRRRRRPYRKVSILTEIEPKNQRKCVIRGWLPVLINGIGTLTGLNIDIKRAEDQTKLLAAFKPQFQFQQVTATGWENWHSKVDHLALGGWSLGVMSLEAFYQEHTDKRNRWSTSNCGFDLVKYLGTKLYFVPCPYQDYIVYIDEEYHSTEEMMKQCLHPAVVITHPKSRLIRSIKNGGPRRKLPHMWVPRASNMSSSWHRSKEIANWGLFAYYCAFVDLGCPCIAQVNDPNIQTWWKNRSNNNPDPDWYTYWMQFQKLSGQAGLEKLGGPPTETDRKKFEGLADGPFLQKSPNEYCSWNKDGAPGARVYSQVVWFYKSFWRWGGTVLTLKQVCNPILLGQ